MDKTGWKPTEDEETLSMYLEVQAGALKAMCDIIGWSELSATLEMFIAQVQCARFLEKDIKTGSCSRTIITQT